MPHYYPIVIQAGKSLPGDSLGFHAYSLRIDNLTNQWLLEETSLAWIPPYSLGVCLRLYGTGVAIIINQAPVGQLQLGPIAGESTVGVYSDQLRTEVAGTGVRQFTLVQAVSDLTEGPQPALPPVGVDRLYADAAGNIHHIHSDGTDLILYDIKQPLSGALQGFLPNPTLAGNSVGSAQIVDGSILTADIGNQQITQSTLAKPSVGAAELFAGAAAGNVGGLGGALSGVLPNPSLLMAGTSLTVTAGLAAATWLTILQLTLAAGTWLIWATMQFVNGTAGATFEMRITDGATVWGSGGETMQTSNMHIHLAIGPAILTPSVTTNYSLQGYSSAAGASVWNQSPGTNQPKATNIAALKVI